MRELTADELRALLDYEPATGVFTRINCQYRPDFNGKQAGTSKPTSTGYLTISVNRKRYYAHRLAWLYMTGSWPVEVIDHINGNRADNRWANLRSVSQQANAQNVRGPQANNRTGYLGVYYCTQTGRYRAMLRVGKQRKTLGRFDTPEEAYSAYLTAKRELHQGFMQ